MDGISALGAGVGTAIHSLSDYRHHLKRNMIQPLDNIQPNQITTLLFVVSKLGPVTKSTGTDYILPLWAIDPTTTNLIRVSIYRRSVESMPNVRSPGDIVYFEGAKTGVKDGKFAQQITPIAKQKSTSRFNTAYLKQVCDVSFDKFSDLLLEVLHVLPREQESPTYGGMMQRCLVTDYSENPLLSVTDIRLDTPVVGNRLAWLTVHQIDKLNKMPNLVAGKKYWMRNVRGASSTRGLHLVVSPHTRFPRTIMVVEVEDSHPDLAPMMDRRQRMMDSVGDAGVQNSMSNAMEHDLDVPMIESHVAVEPRSKSPQYNADGGNDITWTSALVMPISSICTGHQLTTRFHVRAKITNIFPPTADQSIVSICTMCSTRYDSDHPHVCSGCQQHDPKYREECQFMLELTDASAKCLAMCPNAATASKLAGHTLQTCVDNASVPSSAVDALRRVWAWVQSRGECEWINVLVALVLVPGPGPDGTIVRCLMVADIAHPLPSILT
ncbi:hypothetical protein IW147_000103 [Coemansia sp. RSA 720]|nr:hypothetical protein IW147_000103 [Coemansia sp. RSA 720]KAJ2545502.1 hypothetical protein GGF49_000309 [Coemansia sp. RSA 1853]